jgi:hypothetical protein
MKLKTSELTGAALDWAVAKCEGLSDKEYCPDDKHFRDAETFEWFCPSSNWAQGGPIIEREGISITGTGFTGWECEEGWYAHICNTKDFIEDRYEHGPTPLIAAMRCYVASKLGDEVEVPEELR